MKNKRICSFLILLTVCIVTAFSFLKSSAVSSQKNEIKTNPDTEYQITYELNGGRFEGEYPKTFKISQETAIPNPIKEGSEFLGWTINDKTDVLPIKNYKIPSMTQGDIKLTANWQLQGNILVNGQTFKSTVESMSNFNNVTEIQFIKDTPNPNGINLAQNGSIKANIDANILTIACEDEIIANTDCDQMFWGFNKIKTIKFDNFNTSQVRFMNGMFRSCESLTTLDLSSFDTSKVTDTVWMFFNCTKLNANITIMNPDVTYYNNTFQGCSTDPSARFIVKYISPKTKEIARQIVSTKSDNSNVFLYEEPSTLLDGQTFNNKIKSLSSFTNVYKVIFDYGIPSNISSYPNVDVSGNGSIIAYVDGDTLYVVSNGDIIANPTSSHLFRYCYNLVSIDFTNNFKTDDVTQINSMFESSNRLTEIKGLEKFNTNNVKDMSAMFFGCSSLKTANTTNFNTSQVTNMSYMFKDCNNLSGEITISNLNTNYYREMFTSCSTDPSAKFIVKYTTSETKEVARKMVETKSEKSNVYLDGTQPEPSAKLIDGTIFNSTISGMSGFENVTEIRFIKGTPNPDGVDVSETQDGTIKAYIEGTILTVASKGEIYANHNSMQMFYEFGYTYGKNKSLNRIVFTNFNTSQVTNMYGMFYQCSNLTEIIGLEKWDTSQVTNMGYMFNYCVSLVTLDVSNWNTSKVIDMEGMFETCHKLSGSITIINPNMRSYINMFRSCSINPSAKFIVKYINEATKVVAERIVTTKSYNSNVFLYEPPKPATLMNGQRFNSTIKGMSGFENVTEIRFVNGTPKPNGVNVAIEGEAKGYIEGNVLTVACEGEIFTNENCGGMFMACSSLTSIDLRNLNTTQATNMSEMFAFCNSLKSLDVTNLNTSQVTDMVEMFSYCSSLTSLVGIENWDTSQVTDMSNMFRDCISLTKLDLSKLNLSQLWNMGDMFYMCKNLSGEITITHPNPRFTAYLFTECSTNPKSKFVVNYTSGRREIAQNMIYTKSSNSNVVLGTEVNTLNEDIPNNEKPSVPDTVVLTIKDGNTTTTKEIIAGEIGSLNTPSKEGMIFSGYFYDAEFTKPVSERDIISEDTTIYIKWEEAPQEETPQVEEIPQEENKDESFGEVA